jgi:tetrahydromethanopterin S-methyltransferase subunit A
VDTKWPPVAWVTFPVTREEVEAFRRQVELVALLGEEDPNSIQSRVESSAS